MSRNCSIQFEEKCSILFEEKSIYFVHACVKALQYSEWKTNMSNSSCSSYKQERDLKVIFLSSQVITAIGKKTGSTHLINVLPDEYSVGGHGKG